MKLETSMGARFVSWWRHSIRGADALLHEAQTDRNDADELQHFYEETVNELVRQGMPRTQAERQARASIGNPTSTRETVRAARWENAVHSVVTDISYALRMLRRSPVFSVVVVLVIALGIGAVTSILSAANALLFTPISGAVNADRLVGIDRVQPGTNGGAQASQPYYVFLRERNRTLSAMAAWGKADFSIGRTTGNGESVAVYGNIVSANFFSVLGVTPYLGRFFLPEEDATPNTHPVVVVAYDFWRTTLGADSTLIGNEVLVNGTAFTLVGVAPPKFRGVFTPIISSAWVPLMMVSRIRPTSDVASPHASWLWMFGRMRDGVNREAVRADLVALTKQRIAERVEDDWMWRLSDVRLVSLTGLPDDAQKVIRAFMSVLLGVSLLVLLIACVNVAAMLSARALARMPEMAIRVALGAARGRVIRQLLTENLVLFAIGAGAGIAIAMVATWAFERLPLPNAVPISLELSPDWRVMMIALVVSLFTGLLFGVVPARQAASADIQSRMRGDSRSGGRIIGGVSRGLVSNVLVVAQLALSLVLLVSAGLLLRALVRGAQTDPGFQARGVTVTTLRPEAWGYDAQRATAFYQLLEERVRAIPGVTAVSYTERLPLQFSSSGDNIQLDDAPIGKDGKRQGTVVTYSLVGEQYFDVLRLPLMSGRTFVRGDDSGSARVAVVNEQFVKRYWPQGNAVGRSFTFHDRRVTVVGVARNAKYASLTEPNDPHLYFPLAQEMRNERSLMVRSGNNANSAGFGEARPVSRETELSQQRAMQAAIRDAIKAIDAALPRADVTSLEKSTSFALLPQRIAAMVTGAMGAVGLLLATVGLYGIISYSVSRRSREIGIRMALGARAQDVQRLVLASGMKLAGLGVLIGLILAMGASQLLVAYLYGVSPLDAPTFVATAALFIAVAWLASWLPARRAAGLDPVVVLRQG